MPTATPRGNSIRARFFESVLIDPVDTMSFNVGPWVYHLRITRRRITGTDGTELLGRADYMNREILISSQLPPAGRLDVLLHELKHCFLFHFPRPRNTEEECNFAATFTTAAMLDLAAQGGDAALRLLKPAPATRTRRMEV